MCSLLPSMRKGFQASADRFAKSLLNQHHRSLVNQCQNIWQTDCQNKSKYQVHSPTRSYQNVEDFAVMQSVKIESPSILSVRYKNGKMSTVPHVWLRDNCQCSECFDHDALARKSLLAELNTNVTPVQTNVDESGKLSIKWDDGHESVFNSSWMYRRQFEKNTSQIYNQFVNMKKETWSSDHVIKDFIYTELLENKKTLFNFLVTMEISGVAKVTGCPVSKCAATDLCNHISMVKRSHYGTNSVVTFIANANNLASRTVELGLHTDLPFYEYQPGLVLLHIVEQAKNGGQSIVADGFHAANNIKRTNPAAYELLSTLPVFFWDKGYGVHPGESEEFYKITKVPQILLDRNNEITRISFNNGVRDSYLDLPVEKVKTFYEAMKLYNDELYKNSITLKLNSGEIMVLDNVRCLHGRSAFNQTENRYLETCYIDWDEAKCCRRRLQAKDSEFDLHRIVI